MSKNKFVNIPPSVLALTQLVRLRVNNNPVMPHSFLVAMRTDRRVRGEKREGERSGGQAGERLALDDRHNSPELALEHHLFCPLTLIFIDRSRTRCRTIGSKKM